MVKLPGASVTPRAIEKHAPGAEAVNRNVVLWLGTPILGKAERVRSAPMSDINLLGYGERIVNLDTKISDSALDFRMSQQ